MDMSRWASNALAACSLELDSLAYHGIPNRPPTDVSGACRPVGPAGDPGHRPLATMEPTASPAAVGA